MIKPMLFNTDMARAILDDRKMVTRRVVKPQPSSKLAYVCMGYKHGTWGYPDKDAWKYWNDEDYRLRAGLSDEEKTRRWTPPCHTGDILYVRETWQEVYETEYDVDGSKRTLNIRDLISNFDDIPKVEDGISRDCATAIMEPRMKYYVFKASDIRYVDPSNGLLWRPSIHMPREAARIFLRVTDVNVERLQSITELDILEKEGVTVDFPQPKPSYMSLAYTETRLKPAVRKKFADLWNSTIKTADRALYGWDANPWVWVITFERCEPPEGWAK